MSAQVDFYNDTILAMLPGEPCTYFATDSLKEADEAGLGEDAVPVAILDWVASHAIHGLPPHTLRLKRRCVCRLIHNMDNSWPRQECTGDRGRCGSPLTVCPSFTPKYFWGGRGWWRAHTSSLHPFCAHIIFGLYPHSPTVPVITGVQHYLQ